MAFGPTGDATCLRLCARLLIPANARACPHIKPSRRPFRLSALCSNRVEQLQIIDLVTARLDAKSDAYVVELPSLRLRDVRIDARLVQEHDRMLTGGFYAEIDLAY